MNRLANFNVFYYGISVTIFYGFLEIQVALLMIFIVIEIYYSKYFQRYQFSYLDISSDKNSCHIFRAINRR